MKPFLAHGLLEVGDDISQTVKRFCHFCFSEEAGLSVPSIDKPSDRVSPYSLVINVNYQTYSTAAFVSTSWNHSCYPSSVFPCEVVR